MRRAATAVGLVLLAVPSACRKKAEDTAVVVPEEVVEVLDATALEELAVEEVQLEKIRSGWKARAYRGTRKGLVKSALGLIGAMEGQSSQPLIQNLPPEVRAAIEAAGGEAGSFKAMAEDPPAEISLVIATGYLVNLQKTPALCELELIDEDEFKTPGGGAGFHVVRGVTYFMHGLKQHGLRDLRRSNLGEAKSLAPEVRVALYSGAAAAAIAADEPRMWRTQLELAEEIAPGEPLILFLRAEGEISKGRYEEAGQRLTAWRIANPSATGVVAEAIDQRIRLLEEGDESMQTILVEPKWLVNFSLDYIAEQGKSSAAFRKIDEVTGTARSLMTGLLENLSGFGS